MKILHINSDFTFSRSFNSRSWNSSFVNIGLENTLLSMTEINSNQDKHLISFSEINKYSDRRKFFVNKIENRLGRQNEFQFWTNSLYKIDFLKSFDVLHFHLVHGNQLSFRSMQNLSRIKPTVWTWHDPWPLTGHCIYPDSCKNFDNKCLKCPDLLRPFSVGRDRTYKNRELKEEFLKKISCHVHVASQWMTDLIVRSGITLRHEITKIPLPVNLNVEKLTNAEVEFKQKYKIPKDNLVIGLRDTKQFQKNPRMIQQIFMSLPDNFKMTIISVDDKGLISPYSNKFQVIELGNVTDDAKLCEFYAGIDLFLALSTSEAYGMMAAEAIFCNTPVMALANTATSEFINTQRGFIVISLKDAVETLKQIYSKRDSLEKLEDLLYSDPKKDLDSRLFAESMKSLYLKSIELF